MQRHLADRGRCDNFCRSRVAVFEPLMQQQHRAAGHQKHDDAEDEGQKTPEHATAS